MESNCLKVIGTNSFELFKSAEFLKISKSSLNKIVEYEMLPCREIALFEAVNKWAEFAQSEAKSDNKRVHVDGLVQKIRFGSMSVAEFGKCPGENTILTKSEIADIFTNLTSPASSNPEFFNQRLIHRNLAELPLQKCLRFDDCPITTIGSLGGYTEFNFSVDKNVYLCGYGILGRIPSALVKYKTATVDIRLSDDFGNVLSEKSEKITFDGTDKVFDVLFKSPVLIEPFKSYTAYCYKSGPTNVFQNFWGTDGRTEIGIWSSF